jgi:hypothetical protein
MEANCAGKMQIEFSFCSEIRAKKREHHGTWVGAWLNLKIQAFRLWNKDDWIFD